MDDFLQWLISPEGQRSEQVLFAVLDAIENASVDPDKRKIVWTDGARLSIRETAKRIQAEYQDVTIDELETHIIGWLEQHYEPKGLDEKQMEHFECIIDTWIEHHRKNSDRHLEIV